MNEVAGGGNSNGSPSTLAAKPTPMMISRESKGEFDSFAINIKESFKTVSSPIEIVPTHYNFRVEPPSKALLSELEKI